MTLAQIIEAMHGLNKRDLKAVQITLDKLLQPSNFDHDLFQAVLDQLGVKGSLRIFQATANYKIWLKNQECVENLLAKLLVGKTHPSKVYMIRMKHFLVSLLLDYLRSRGEVNLFTISSGLGNIELIFESAFPGYLINGFPFLLLKALANGGKDEAKGKGSRTSKRPRIEI